MNLLRELQGRFHEALAGLIADPAPYAAMVKSAQDARFGDYQANCAMSLGKVLGQPPRTLAQTIVERLRLDDLLEAPEIAGPGFINLRLRTDWLALQVRAMAADDRLGVSRVQPAQTFVIDYSSPNVAKPMHVGHLRSTIIGDALARLLRFLGHNVVTDNHLGDWGAQFGILLYGYKNLRDEAAFHADPVRELARLYLEVRRQMKEIEDESYEDPDNRVGEDRRGARFVQAVHQPAANLANPVAEACRRETAKLHAGDPENLRLWKMFMPACLEEINRIYRRLDVRFDHTLGESFYNPMLSDVVKSLLERGIAQESNGAIIIPRGEDAAPSLIRKTDGAFTYTTTDLATIQYRTKEWKPDAILYVVDFRQQEHFGNLFHAARRWGCTALLEHVSFGAVLSKEGKPLKTREGGVPELNGLLDDAVERAAQVYEAARRETTALGDNASEMSQETLRTIYEVVGLGAVKYADLSQNRASDYKYDPDKMMAMDGNTGTYMQYAYARNRSIFRKGNVDAVSLRTNPAPVILEKPEERALAAQLLRFEECLTLAAAEYKPSFVTTYLWDLAKTYSGFFQNCPVLKAETPDVRQSRLLLSDLTARVIQRGLDLLGIGVVERM
jgi:arginyl-tRNA synthetase